MRYYVCILAVFGTLLYSGVSSAKIYWLPDYLGKNMERTYVPQDGSHSNEVSCSSYGMYDSTQSGMTCNISYPASGLTCYSCQACDSEYKYTTVECPTSTYTLANQCGGNYKNCNCNTALYPTTTTTGGCQYGFIPDINNYCEDKPDGTKHYACVKPECKPDNITVEDCQAQGNGHNCTASKEANCTDYCDSNGCQDNCAYLKQTGQARSDCQYGCAVGKDVSGCSGLCYECAAPDAPTNTCADIYDGKSNTATIISQLGADALAATAANQFYVGDKNGDFGQGKWYLPSIGELVDIYGVDSSKITNGSGTSGALGGYKKRINTALKTLKTKGAEAEVIILSLWSSSEMGYGVSWVLSFSNGNRGTGTKVNAGYVRPFQLVENCFAPAGSGVTAPKVGNVLYADKTWGSADDYDGSKQAVGIISAVGNDGSVKIVSLKFLTFSSQGNAGNFNPDKPYGGSVKVTQWITQDKESVNVVGVPNYSISQLKTMLKKCATDEKLCSGPTIAECEASGAGYSCVASTEEGCSNYCASECMDMCRYEQVVNNAVAVSNCQYGCAVGKEVSGCSDLCYECATKTSVCAAVYDGKSNTTAIISQLGADALAATAANQYYVGDKNGDFGQGKWYLPSIGELVDMYGVDPDQITDGNGIIGATGGYLKEINDVLTTLYDKGIDTDILSDSYWSSSEHSADHVWKLTVSSAYGSGNRSYALKDYSDHTYVRAFLQVKSCFNTSGGTIPVIGRVMYDDKTWGHVRDYYSGSSKKPVGIIASVNKTDGSVKIVSLKNLTFSSIESSGNFDADNPYGGKYEESVWAPYDKREVDVTAVPNYSSDKLKPMLKTCATKEKPICPFTNAELSAIFDGKENTQKIVAQLGNKALAAYATTQFYVGDKNGAFGQGQWYLPAIGELMDFYGTDVSKMTDGKGNSGVVGDNKAKISAALNTLQNKGVDAGAISYYSYWSSSEFYNDACWSLYLYDGRRSADNGDKFYSNSVRPCQLLENCFDPTSGSTPKIGDVMYADKTWGSANDYDGSKQAVGIVSTVGNDGSVKIISLKDLTFRSYGSVGNFNPDNPYGGSIDGAQWTIRGIQNVDVVDIPNYNSKALLTVFKICRE